jgi:hypothetical protein
MREARRLADAVVVDAVVRDVRLIGERRPCARHEVFATDAIPIRDLTSRSLGSPAVLHRVRYTASAGLQT